MNRFTRIIKKAGRDLYLYSGLRHIREMGQVKEPNAPDYQKPPTLFLWIIGLYVALYGLAATNYEAMLDRVENRMNAVVAQLATSDDAAFKSLVAQIRDIQRMKTPLEPSLLWPFDSLWNKENKGHFVLASFFSKAPNPEIAQWTRDTIKAWKGRLAGVNLAGMDLTGARLSGANLSGAWLWKADLSGAWLWKANLSGAVLSGTDLPGARLSDANLSGAVLGGVWGEIRNWQQIVSIENANILGVQGAPKGFRAWALENGAVELAPAAWKAFVENGYESVSEK
uniref:Pentapeptide repeat-containing protein n=1 Tax=Candidatus Kentrum sp. LPFa TaxID=2126335 RepID=A0A450Y0D9_9GAMM|nr:MAG: Pentapeptide repeat-containing protein [Candidatus Kentron sp. LPFa]VFK34993.1 MAG: Pentapeptide repeat-containing protein [Candidatus Kentron sp. LPFa]